MKTKKILFFLISSFILTGCASNTKTLTCTTSGDFKGLESNATIELKIKNKELFDASIDIDTKVPANERQNFINNYKQTSNKMTITETAEGIRLSGGMDSSFFDNLGLTKEINYNEVKEVMELQGYTCE